MNYKPINLKDRLSKFDDLWSPRVIAEMNVRFALIVLKKFFSMCVPIVVADLPADLFALLKSTDLDLTFITKNLLEKESIPNTQQMNWCSSVVQ